MRNLKQTELKRLKNAKKIEQEGEQIKTDEGRKRTSETEDHEKQRLATLKRLKRGDDNELKRNLRLEKVVASKQLRLNPF